MSHEDAGNDADQYWTPSATSRWLRLCRKELREILRDRRTILTLILMPLLLYPLLSMSLGRFLGTGAKNQGAPIYRIGVVSEDQGREVMRYLRLGAQSDRTPLATAGEPPPVFELVLVADVDQAVLTRGVDAAISPPPKGKTLEPSRDGRASTPWNIVYLEGSSLSEGALEALQQRLAASNLAFLGLRLQAAGLQSVTLAVEIVRRGLVDPKARKQASLAAVLPLILILMTITGAVYPAIDLTAGERERGTLELLVAAPVSRLAVLLAKYVAVVTVALLTGVVNLTAMAATIWASGLSKLFFGSGLSPRFLFEILGLLVLLAAFFSAVLLVLTSVARSFKEAQAYLIPLMLVSLTPGIVSLMPEVRLTGWRQFTPLLGLVLLARDLFWGEAAFSAGAAVVASTAVYSLLMLALAARLFGSEATLYSAPAAWSDLWRRSPEARSAPSVAGAVLVLVFAFPGLFFSHALAAGWATTFVGRLMLSMGATVVLLWGFPTLIVWRDHVSWRNGFALIRPSVGAAAAGVVLGLSVWPWASELLLWQRELGWTGLTSEQMEQVKALAQTARESSPWLLIVGWAIIPAFCEEWCFRGQLQTALRATMAPWRAAVISGVAFGVFHLVALDALALERLLPSTLMGLVLAAVRERTGSLWPGVLLHAVHNALLALMAYYEPELSARGWGNFAGAHLPPTWLAVSGVGVVVGFVLLNLVGKRTTAVASPL